MKLILLFFIFLFSNSSLSKELITKDNILSLNQNISSFISRSYKVDDHSFEDCLQQFNINNDSPINSLIENIKAIPHLGIGMIWDIAENCERTFAADENCFSSAFEMFSHLDTSLPTLYPVFSSEFRELMKSKEVNKVFNRMDKHLTDNPNKEFNTWNWLLSQPEISGDQIKATKWMAIIFQDTFGMRHMKFSRSRLNGELISKVLKKLKKKEKAGLVDWYPDDIDTPNGGSSPYHFYTGTYLTIKMKASGISDKLAVFLPYQLNYIYEEKYSKNNKDGYYSSRTKEDILQGLRGSQLGISLATNRKQQYLERKKFNSYMIN